MQVLKYLIFFIGFLFPHCSHGAISVESKQNLILHTAAKKTDIQLLSSANHLQKATIFFEEILFDEEDEEINSPRKKVFVTITNWFCCPQNQVNIFCANEGFKLYYPTYCSIFSLPLFISFSTYRL